MLRSPQGFEPTLDVELTDDAIAHVFAGDALVLFGDSPGGLPWRFYREAGLRPERVHSVGRHAGRAHVAVGLPEGTNPRAMPEGLRANGLRNWFGLVDDETLAIAMRAVQLLEWERKHRFCGACGTRTERVSSERSMKCPACNLAVYPRISPAMMVLVTRGRELLLGRGVNFPAGRFSALAGFLEAGETIEEAVHREVQEEVGLQVKNLRYFASQSWPFPDSLMIAFRAEWAGGDITVDPNELAEAHWFTPDNLPNLPPPLSVARALIESTLAELRDA